MKKVHPIFIRACDKARFKTFARYNSKPSAIAFKQIRSKFQNEESINRNNNNTKPKRKRTTSGLGPGVRRHKKKSQQPIKLLLKKSVSKFEEDWGDDSNKDTEDPTLDEPLDVEVSNSSTCKFRILCILVL